MNGFSYNPPNNTFLFKKSYANLKQKSALKNIRIKIVETMIDCKSKNTHLFK